MNGAAQRPSRTNTETVPLKDGTEHRFSRPSTPDIHYRSSSSAPDVDIEGLRTKDCKLPVGVVKCVKGWLA